MGAASGMQGGQMRPQQPQQQPMGGQQAPRQGKGPGLPIPQQPQMGGNRPYQPVGANNGPFNQNPVQQVNQPQQPLPIFNGGANDYFSGANMPQGKGPIQMQQGVPPQILNAFKMQQMQNPNAKGPAGMQALQPMMQQQPNTNIQPTNIQPFNMGAMR
jgi:hypothetical protein